jgi:hypothetical protein
VDDPFEHGYDFSVLVVARDPLTQCSLIEKRVVSHSTESISSSEYELLFFERIYSGHSVMNRVTGICASISRCKVAALKILEDVICFPIG